MQVICERTCVTWIDGAAFSMSRGKKYDLPTEKAKSLARSGKVRPAQAPSKTQKPSKPRLDLEPQGEGPVSDSPEPPVVAADLVQDPDKADSGDEPAAEPPTPKKRSPRTKRLDGPPENK